MILRRFMKHVSDQNWFAVGLDVLVVITGIFLGMQVTDWNEKRIAVGKFNDLLELTREENAANLAVLQDRNADVVAMLAALETMRSIVETCAADDESQQRFIDALPVTLRDFRATLNLGVVRSLYSRTEGHGFLAVETREKISDFVSYYHEAERRMLFNHQLYFDRHIMDSEYSDADLSIDIGSGDLQGLTLNVPIADICTESELRKSIWISRAILTVASRSNARLSAQLTELDGLLEQMTLRRRDGGN